MRGAKVDICRERNKYVKIKKIVGIGISVYFILKIKNGTVQVAASPKKLKLFKLPVIEVIYNYEMPFQLSHILRDLYHFN